MLKTALRESASGFLSRAQLLKLKLKAIRAGVWFRTLPRIDRVLFDLTIKVANKIRSITLARNILTIITKLESLLESSPMRALKGRGLRLAQKISLIAQKWGNISAKNWPSDPSFVYFLGVLHMNEHKPLKYNSRLHVGGCTR
jgi:hypothetical protein